MSINKNSAPQLVDKLEFSNFGDDDFHPDSGWIMLLYGASGSGKTWFCGTADHSLYINTGGGIETLGSPLFKNKYPSIQRKVINIYEKFSGNTINKATAFDKTTDVLDMFLGDAELKEWIKTVIIDDATSLRSFAKLRGVEIVDDMAGRTGNSRRKLNRFIHQLPDDVFREMSMIEWFCLQYIPTFRNEGINFILTAHERQIYGKASKMMDDRPLKAIKPGFSGQTFPDEVPKHFDEVWYIEKKYSEKHGQYSQIKTGGSGIELVKTRNAGVFGIYEVNKSFEQLLSQRKLNELHPSYQNR